VIRALFYASPIIYGLATCRAVPRPRRLLNPLSGIFALYRVGLFPDQWDPRRRVAAVMSLAFLALGIVVFRRLEPAVLKEL
jgi:ABC-2 type transport system permease protein